MNPDYERLEFKTGAEWRAWLDAHHATTNGVWIKMYKKATGKPTVTNAEALDAALSYGWIDGLRRGLDEESYLQKYTPRRKTSLWSKRNIEIIDRLTNDGHMMPAGHAEVDRAKTDGRWAAAYDKPSEAVAPAEFLAELKKYPEAETFYDSLNKTNKYAIIWRLQTAKTDATRQKRIDQFISMLKDKEKLH